MAASSEVFTTWCMSFTIESIGPFKDDERRSCRTGARGFRIRLLCRMEDWGAHCGGGRCGWGLEGSLRPLQPRLEAVRPMELGWIVKVVGSGDGRSISFFHTRAVSFEGVNTSRCQAVLTTFRHSLTWQEVQISLKIMQFPRAEGCTGCTLRILDSEGGAKAVTPPLVLTTRAAAKRARLLLVPESFMSPETTNCYRGLLAI